MGLFNDLNKAFLNYEKRRKIRKKEEPFAGKTTISLQDPEPDPDPDPDPNAPSSSTLIIIIVIILILSIVGLFITVYSYLVCLRCNAGNAKDDQTLVIELLLLTVMMFLLPALFHLVYIIYKKSNCNPKQKKELQKLL